MVEEGAELADEKFLVSGKMVGEVARRCGDASRALSRGLYTCHRSIINPSSVWTLNSSTSNPTRLA